MSPKTKVPANIMKQYKQDQEARKKENQAARQGLAEHFSQIAANVRQKVEKQERQKLQERITESKADGQAVKDEVNLLRDEGYQYSLALARQKTQNRVEVLTMDKAFYAGEIQKFKDKELNHDFLMDTLSSVEDELAELKINLEVSTMSTMSTDGGNYASTKNQ